MQECTLKEPRTNTVWSISLVCIYRYRNICLSPQTCGRYSYINLKAFSVAPRSIALSSIELLDAVQRSGTTPVRTQNLRNFEETIGKKESNRFGQRQRIDWRPCVQEHNLNTYFNESKIINARVLINWWNVNVYICFWR